MALWEKPESEGWDTMGAPLHEAEARRDMELYEGMVSGQKILDDMHKDEKENSDDEGILRSDK